MPTLLARWTSLFSAATPTDEVHRVGADLLTRWSEPHRYYHTLAHLVAMLDIVEDNIERAADSHPVRLATWFHDAIYQPRRRDNEAASAALAQVSLAGLGVAGHTVDEVARLVRLSASHDPAPSDTSGQLFTDADLAILAAPPAAYASYVAAIRREYSHVDDATFRTARVAVLRRLLSLTPLYHTPVLHHAWEKAARCNLHNELSTMGIQLDPPAPDNAT